eukprot:325468-Pyramimonas_sp.AAC.1
MGALAPPTALLPGLLRSAWLPGSFGASVGPLQASVGHSGSAPSLSVAKSILLVILCLSGDIQLGVLISFGRLLPWLAFSSFRSFLPPPFRARSLFERGPGFEC